MIRNKKNNIEITVGNRADRKRIDTYLTEILADRSRSHIQKLIDGDNVLIDGRAVSKNHKVTPGEILMVKSLDDLDKPVEIEPQKIDLNILFEDDDLLIISKPPGISVHPSPGNYTNTLVNALLFHFKSNMKDFPDHNRPGIVHRLDKETSGVLLIAKNYRIQSMLSGQFKERQVEKRYTALVLGLFVEKSGEIMLPIGRSRRDRKKMQVSIDRGREAMTVFEVRDSFRNNCSLLNVYPKTGRTHQIRVHFSYIDHPLIGDKNYGNKDTQRLAKDIGLERHFLHASRLSFVHPVTNDIIDIEDKLPEDLLKALEFLEEFKI